MTVENGIVDDRLQSPASPTYESPSVSTKGIPLVQTE